MHAHSQQFLHSVHRPHPHVVVTGRGKHFRKVTIEKPRPFYTLMVFYYRKYLLRKCHVIDGVSVTGYNQLSLEVNYVYFVDFRCGCSHQDCVIVK